MAKPEIKETPTDVEVSRKDVKDLQSLKEYYSGATEQERQKLTKEFQRYVEPDLKQAPWLQDDYEGEDSSEILEPDLENLSLLQKYQKRFENALTNHPNVDWTSRIAVNNMLYGFMKNSEKQIEKVIGIEKGIEK